MSDVTKVLLAIEAGEENASEELLPLVYQELRKLAASKLTNSSPGQSLQPTILVHEAYLRLVDSDQPQRWDGRRNAITKAALFWSDVVPALNRSVRSERHRMVSPLVKLAFEHFGVRAERRNILFCGSCPNFDGAVVPGGDNAFRVGRPSRLKRA